MSRWNATSGIVVARPQEDPWPSPTTAIRPLVVKITCGAEALERLNQGLTVAVTAARVPAPTSACGSPGTPRGWPSPAGPRSSPSPTAPPSHELRDALLADATVTVCGQCAARRDLSPDDLLEGATIRGAAAYVEEILRPDAQAIVY